MIDATWPYIGGKSVTSQLLCLIYFSKLKNFKSMNVIPCNLKTSQCYITWFFASKTLKNIDLIFQETLEFCRIICICPTMCFVIGKSKFFDCTSTKLCVRLTSSEPENNTFMTMTLNIIWFSFPCADFKIILVFSFPIYINAQNTFL